METKDQWIGRTMESFEGMEAMACPPELKERLMIGFPEKSRTVILYSLRSVWKAAAVILILLGLNIVTILQYSGNETKEENAGTVASEYFSYIDNFNL